MICREYEAWHRHRMTVPGFMHFLVCFSQALSWCSRHNRLTRHVLLGKLDRGDVLSPQVVQQGLSFLEIGRVKAFSKPVVHRSEQLTGFVSLALPLLQPAQACRSTEFERFGLLVVGDVECPMKTDFCLSLVVR